MSFHGGMLGSIVACWIYGKQRNLPFFDLTDFAVPVVPIGLGLGRIGNFINGNYGGGSLSCPGEWCSQMQMMGCAAPISIVRVFFRRGLALYYTMGIFKKAKATCPHHGGVFSVLWNVSIYG